MRGYENTVNITNCNGALLLDTHVAEITKHVLHVLRLRVEWQTETGKFHIFRARHNQGYKYYKNTHKNGHRQVGNVDNVMSIHKR